jgi:tetratricopeptide (TPR) repeat protein
MKNRAASIISIFLVITVMIALFSDLGYAAPRSSKLPPEARALMDKGLQAAAKKDFKQAAQHFNDARKIAPYSPAILFNLGVAETQIPDRHIAAMACLKSFLILAPKSANAPQARSLYRQTSKLFDATLRYYVDKYKQLVESMPPGKDKDSAMPSVADYYARIGDYAEALRIAGEAGSYKSIVYQSISEQQSRSGDFNEASDNASRAGIGRATAYCMVAIMQAERGDVAGAARSVELSRLFNPGGCNIDRKGIYDRVISAQLGRKDYKGAGETLSKASSEGISMPPIYNVEILAAGGNIDDALRTVQSMRDKKPEGYAAVAIAQARKKDFKSALQTAALARSDEDDFPIHPQFWHSTRDYVYYRISLLQAVSNDIPGAKKTASLILPNSTVSVIKGTLMRDSALHKINIAGQLLKSGDSRNLEARVEEFLRVEAILDMAYSPSYPWLVAPREYIASLNTGPEKSHSDLQFMFRRALMGALSPGQEDASEGGLLNTRKRLKALSE